MKTVTIELTEPTANLLEKLPEMARQQITTSAIEALLNGTLYPTGSEQLELAIDLAEAGVESDVISKLTRLEPELFESFTKK
jgi:hypothetical protein